MAITTLPGTEDVVIQRRASNSYTIGVAEGAPQIACGTLEEALHRAIGYAGARHVDVWFTTDGAQFSHLADDRLLRRVWSEFMEMPGMRLTPRQAQRLWGVDAPTCAALLEELVAMRFLTQTADGHFMRATEGGASPRLKMLKAERTAPARAHGSTNRVA